MTTDEWMFRKTWLYEQLKRRGAPMRLFWKLFRTNGFIRASALDKSATQLKHSVDCIETMASSGDREAKKLTQRRNFKLLGQIIRGFCHGAFLSRMEGLYSNDPSACSRIKRRSA